MIILPAIDIKDGVCVRLQKGDYATAHKVAESAVETAKQFCSAGAEWIHMVDLDGAKDAKPVNSNLIFEVLKSSGLKVEVGGGIRTMETVDYYLEHGISRVILGSAAVNNPEFVKEAVKKYGGKIAVGIDARGGKVAAEGWTETSEVDYIDLAKRMENVGVKTIIFTDIACDGMLSGPNLTELDKLNNAVSCNIIASGGVSNLKDIIDLLALQIYGAICGKAIYTGDLSLENAVKACMGRATAPHKQLLKLTDAELERFFVKSDLIPAIVQEAGTKQVLMLAYMNRESLKMTLETGYTWFYSRSRQELWNKGATSGHMQRVSAIYGDCDDDTLLVVAEQTGSACHTGSHSCFYHEIWRENG